ncbi:hypothetical protein GCM10027277_06160 [Pseudoduganella ginsengisoli]|uniref:DUF2268 domain-containing protein n=1 Tax=Pseudoduganella ginsengisoli TaxID=1462440 RepID=A0A6L6Q3Z9_9BURK|nr:hypothetical protein [Pseudoduganella ginsengisoli]MTW04315.1 hypothetical protein [Pseudoduganella ginsengisoli]
MKIRNILMPVIALCSSAVFAAAGVDPLTAEIGMRDAQRFAELMKGKTLPTAEALQSGYLDGGGLGVQIFTPMRIAGAQQLARQVAKDPETYRYTIKECLPRLPQLQADLKQIYLGYTGLLPERPLPRIETVFGRMNSGGTASTEAQVIGLEVACPLGATFEQFRTNMRMYFAHETVHTWQQDPDEWKTDPLLSQALLEGVADYLASLVMAEVPKPERDRWARQREAWLWQEFSRDRQALNADPASLADPAASSRFKRWFNNCGDALDGWPCEAGYWVGMRIAESYVARAPDKHAAIRKLLELESPAAILKASGYQP